MALDRRYLEKHGLQWRVQMKVPKHLQKVLGKAKLVKPLHTDSLAQANRLRWPVIAEFKAVFEEAGRGQGIHNPIVAEALAFRKDWEVGVEDPLAFAQYGPNGELDANSAMVLTGWAGERAEEITSIEGPETASLFYGVALGRRTPLELMIDTWLSETGMKPRQKIDYKRAVLKFGSFLSRNKKKPVLEAVTKRVCGEYVSSLVGAEIHPRTINKDVSALSSYWRWLIKKGYLETNVWEKQGVAKPKAPRNQQKRPYSDVEMECLFNAPANLFLKDSMTIAALSGMRIEEIAKLKVKDVTPDRCFHISVAKTEAGERMVPIHPYLDNLVRRRIGDKLPDDYLFHELPTPKEGSAVERSQKVSKAFTIFRRSLGVDDVPEGHRQSRIDFHSFRRWFIHEAGQALNNGARGFSQWTLAQVVGHEREQMALPMTMGRYHGDDGIEALRACIESVSLPISVTEISEKM